MNIEETLTQLGSKPSESEENGLGLITNTYQSIFSPGISTGGFAEIRMVVENPDRKVIATTIDEKGLAVAKENIKKLNLDNQIEAKLEDLTKEFPYKKDQFDFIYARLVLHYLKAQDLDKVLSNFYNSLQKDGKLFVIVRSEKNIDTDEKRNNYDPVTKITKVPYRNNKGEIEAWGIRYFHSPKTIKEHLEKAGFTIDYIKEYQERLYVDFMRTKASPRLDHLIEVLASK